MKQLFAPDGRRRTYRLFLPAAAESEGEDQSPAPLVVALHGGGDSGDRFEDVSGLSRLAEREGFVVVYPDGHGEGTEGTRRRSWNAGDCCGPARVDAVDDVGFIDALVGDVARVADIDRARTFAVGHSNGGMMAFRLAIELPGRFAGIGVQSASIAVDSDRPRVPTALIAVHGGGDRHHPIDGGRGPESNAETPYRSVREACAAFAAVSGRTARVTRRPDPELTVTDWSGDGPGDGPGAVRLVEVGAGTHSWMGPAAAAEAARRPDRPPAGGPPFPGFDTTANMWDFLAATC